MTETNDEIGESIGQSRNRGKMIRFRYGDLHSVDNQDLVGSLGFEQIFTPSRRKSYSLINQDRLTFDLDEKLTIKSDNCCEIKLAHPLLSAGKFWNFWNCLNVLLMFY